MYEIKKYNPCEEAVEFRSQYKTFQNAWQDCPRGDWMLWIAKKLGVDLKTLTRTKALCALTVRHLMKDERSIKSCEIALRFADGKATKEELNAAAYAAAAADAAAAAAAYKKNRLQTADICREHLTEAVFEKLKLTKHV